MKYSTFIPTILMCTMFAFSLQGQDSLTKAQFKKYPAGPEGCLAWFPAEPNSPVLEYSPDSSKVYTTETSLNDYHFGVISVEFNEALNAEDDKESLLESYMTYLKETFKIESAAGFGKGHTMERHPSATGIIDYWKDADGDEWAVKGWIDDHYIGFMFIYGKGSYPVYNVQQLFLDGFCFPDK